MKFFERIDNELWGYVCSKKQRELW